ncbi:MAG TPA: hypothetical protein VFP66_13640 [Candidatus Limnocylindrales bacterium]|nr:hypothetical protein [Candidatus Limnocylindrales bacterium]
MQLVDWSGALIGPGSEWFWAMLQFVIVAGTLFGLYRQLRLQSSRDAIEQLGAFDREWRDELYNRFRLEILVALRDGVDPAHIPEALLVWIGGFWEKIGGLVRAGHIDPELLWNGSGGDCAVWWTTLAPVTRRLRAEVEGPTYFENFEWLAGIMNEWNRRSGMVPADEAWLASNMERRIGMFQDLIRVQQSLRTVVVASPEATPPSARGLSAAP